MTVLLGILILSTGVYSYFLIQSIRGVLKKPKSDKNHTVPVSGFSIIIPYRNEQQHIPRLQTQLNNSLQPATNYEVIWVNDHSTDGCSPDSLPHHKNLNLDSEQTGKKAAIREGIKQAQYDRVICLDSDIDINPHFFDATLKNWTEQVHICPVIIKPTGFWSSIWALESHALCGITVGMAKNQNPIMNNGAAWAFHKTDWEKLEIRHLNYPSGDDIFTLEAFKQTRSTFSSGLINPGVVSVEAPSGLRAFFNQRTRWASKSSRIKDPWMVLFGISTILMYLSIIVGVFLSVNDSFSEGFILILSIKYIIDFSLLFLVSIKAGLPHLLWAYPILSIVYPLYAVLVAIASLIYRSDWKGR